MGECGHEARDVEGDTSETRATRRRIVREDERVKKTLRIREALRKMTRQWQLGERRIQ